MRRGRGQRAGSGPRIGHDAERKPKDESDEKKQVGVAAHSDSKRLRSVDK
jgi:hypothetical protein